MARLQKADSEGGNATKASAGRAAAARLKANPYGMAGKNMRAATAGIKRSRPSASRGGNLSVRAGDLQKAALNSNPIDKLFETIGNRIKQATGQK